MSDATDPTIDGPTTRIDGRVVPEWLKDKELWLLWNTVEKMPMAPWHTGHSYRVKWGADADERPETTFDEAKMLADMDPATIHTTYPFPTDDAGDPDLPDRVAPTILLPHETHDPPLMLVDFDDVRDPETGRITDEVAEIVDELGSYTEVSRSGAGLHVFVRARLPDGLGKFIAPLDDAGDIELYDHGRFVGATWDHLAGTPDHIAEAQDLIDALVGHYALESHRKRMGRAVAEATGGASRPTGGGSRSKITGGGDGSRSPYFEIDAADVIGTDTFARYREKSPGPDNQGPHPAHGATSGSTKDKESTNFFLPESGETWYCHAHDVSGNGLSLLATLEDVVDCRDADDLWGDPEKMLETCLHARDRGLVGADVTPPYAALVGAANEADLHMADPEDNRLGEDAHRLAQLVFDELDPADV